jgi:glycosyltransferase involved in cell wall biosynthesis
MPRFSVIVPVYNRAGTVLPTLQSVRDQTFEDFECIVVDDGSADGDELKAVVETLNDPRFRYVRRENGGGGAARNTGIDEATGEFVAFLDSDDRWLAEKLAVQSEQLERFPDRVAYCAAYVDRGVGKYWIRPSRGIWEGEDVGEYLFAANEFIPSPTIALATKAARSVRWDPSLTKGQDLDFALRLSAAGHRFVFSPEPLMIWHDVTEVDRASRTRGSAPARAFLAKNGKLLTAKARRGYAVTYLVYDLAKERPLKAAAQLLAGVIAGVPLRIVARQSLRAFLPRAGYRALVNRFIAAAGK